MKAKDKIVTGLKTLAREHDVRRVSLAEIVRVSGVSWPTVRRHVGGREGLAAFVESEGTAVPKTEAAVDEDRSDVKMKILVAAFRVFSEKGYPGASHGLHSPCPACVPTSF